MHSEWFTATRIWKWILTSYAYLVSLLRYLLPSYRLVCCWCNTHIPSPAEKSGHDAVLLLYKHGVWVLDVPRSTCRLDLTCKHPHTHKINESFASWKLSCTMTKLLELVALLAVNGTWCIRNRIWVGSTHWDDGKPHTDIPWDLESEQAWQVSW